MSEHESLFAFVSWQALMCRLGRHRIVPYDPNWPLMTCRYCGVEMK
jgi:hypothetical protein